MTTDELAQLITKAVLDSLPYGESVNGKRETVGVNPDIIARVLREHGISKMIEDRVETNKAIAAYLGNSEPTGRLANYIASERAAGRWEE